MWLDRTVGSKEEDYDVKDDDNDDRNAYEGELFSHSAVIEDKLKGNFDYRVDELECLFTKVAILLIPENKMREVYSTWEKCRRGVRGLQYNCHLQR